jgi:hypothetical protein
MTIILDENLPKPLKGVFPNHTATTVQEQGLAGAVNGALLASMRISGKARLILISRVVLLAAGVAAV